MKSLKTIFASTGLPVLLLVFLCPSDVLSLPTEGHGILKDDLKFKVVTSSLDLVGNFDVNSFESFDFTSLKDVEAILTKYHNPLLSFWNVICYALNAIGITGDQIMQFLDGIVDSIEKILSQLPPEEVMVVEYAAGDILSMLQNGQIDAERLQTDWSIIYTIMWPYVDPDIKPILELIAKIIQWLWNITHPDHPLYPAAGPAAGAILPKKLAALKGMTHVVQ